ncbi:MAG: hypothetical protein PWP28_1848 [Oceanotoga sp.]|nr:hypothetical protein [Oceanotoga sp.]
MYLAKYNKALFIIIIIIFYSILFSENYNVIISDYYPDVFYIEGNRIGFAIDLLNEIENKTSLTFNIESYDWIEAYKKFMEDDKYDVLGFIVPNEYRKEMFDFYTPVHTITSFLMTLNDDEIDYENLKDEKISVIKDSFLYEELKKRGFKNIVEVNSNEKALEYLILKKVRACAIEDERTIEKYIIENDYRYKLRYLEELNTYPITFVSKKGKKIKIFDQELKKILKSEEYYEIFRKWLGIDYSMALETQEKVKVYYFIFLIITSVIIIILVLLFIKLKNTNNKILNKNKMITESLIREKELKEQMNIYSERLKNIYKIFYNFDYKKNIDLILDYSIKEMVKLVPEAEKGSIALIKNNIWKIKAVSGFPNKALEAWMPVESAVKVSNHVKQINNLKRYNNSQNIPLETENIFKEIGSYDIKSTIFIDLLDDNKFIGSISLNSNEDIEFSQDSKEYLEIFSKFIEIFLNLKRREEQTLQAYKYSLKKLTIVAEKFDYETSEHMGRISFLSYELSKEMNFEEEFCKKIREYSFYHDIGKILIPIDYLRKDGKLNSDEWEIIKNHTIYGANIIGNSEMLKIAKNIALFHHEKMDGTGYPIGLMGEEIPIEARIVSVVDVYDALRSKRPYKEAFSHEKSIDILINGDERTKPEHFDKKILEKFIDIIEKNKDLYDKKE